MFIPLYLNFRRLFEIFVVCWKEEEVCAISCEKFEYKRGRIQMRREPERGRLEKILEGEGAAGEERKKKVAAAAVAQVVEDDFEANFQGFKADEEEE